MMKALLLLAALLVAGCGEKSSSEGSEAASENPTPSNESAEPSGDTPKSLSDADVEQLLKEAVDMESLEERDDLYYQPNESEPFSGWAKTMSDSGQVAVLGRLKDGKLDGLWTDWHENGQKEGERTFKDGKRDGLVTTWHEDGQKEEERTYKDGELVSASEEVKPSADSPEPLISDADVERLVKEAVDGNLLQERNGFLYQASESEPYGGWGKEMYDSGQAKGLVQFKDGKEDGPFVGWHENGKKRLEQTFKDGKPDGLMTGWHENGQKQAEIIWKDGKQDGLMTVWHENGQKQYEGIWKDGKQDGLVTTWHENGQKQGEGTYKDGELDGPYTAWHADGQKQSEGTYKDGEEVSAKYWNSKGEEVETAEEAGK